MSAVVDVIEDVVEGVVEIVGDVLDEVLEVADKVMTAVAENPLLIVVAVAAPYALELFAAEAVGATTVMTAAETAIAADTFAASLSAFEVATTAEAIATGTAVLEATGTATTIASAETVAASTVIEAGATVAEATTAATLTAEGATVAEAVSSATAGTVEVSTLTEVASTATETLSSAWETLSSGAQNVIQTIGETLAPGTDATLQKVIGQVTVNTATNGGNLPDALTSTFLSFGTGMIGSEVADATGSKLIGSLASNATNQLVRTGDVDLTNLAGTAAGSLVGAEVAGETGSNLAGKVASTVTKNLVTDQDATTGLINLGVGEIINQGANAVNDFVRSTGVDSAITGEDQGDVVTTGSTENGEIAVAENDAENSGGLTSITGSDVTSTDTTGGLNQVASTDVTTDDTSTTVDDLTGQTTGANNVVTTGGLNQIAATDTTAATTPAEDVLATIGSDTGTTKNVGAVTGTEGDSTAATTDANTGAITGLVTGAATAGANAVKNKLVSTAKKNLTS